MSHLSRPMGRRPDRPVSRFLIFAVTSWSLASNPTSATAGPGDLKLTIRNPNPQHVDFPCNGCGSPDDFGDAVAVLGNNLLVGAPTDDAMAHDGGAAYLFNGSTGELIHTFLSPAGDLSYRFGLFVAAAGDKAVVGTYRDSSLAVGAGAVYLFDSVTGDHLRTLYSPRPTTHGGFGWGIAAMGKNVLVGALGDPPAGVAYLFDGDTGELLKTFENPSPDMGNEFGKSLAAIGEDKVVVGARMDDTAAKDAGAAYVFDAETGELLRTLLPPTPIVGGNFGFSLAALGDDILVGTLDYNVAADAYPEVYLFDGDSGDLLQTFRHPDVPGSTLFGSEIAGMDAQVLIGAGRDPAGGASPGAAYLFDSATGELIREFSGADHRGFGQAVAFMGRDIVVGCPLDPWQGDPYEFDGGAVHVFEGVPEPGTLVLLLCGACALVLCLLRSRRNAHETSS